LGDVFPLSIITTPDLTMTYSYDYRGNVTSRDGPYRMLTGEEGATRRPEHAALQHCDASRRVPVKKRGGGAKRFTPHATGMNRAGSCMASSGAGNCKAYPRGGSLLG